MPFCNQCGKEFEIGEESCSNCGASLPMPPEQVSKQEATTPAVSSAPHLKRFVAGLIDMLIILVIFFFLFSSKKRVFLLIFKRGLALLIPHLYLLLKDSIEGKSVGKLIMGIMVFNEKENKAGGLLDSIIRNWYLAIPFIGPTLFVIIIGSQILTEKRRLGDKSAGTTVITDSDYQRRR